MHNDMPDYPEPKISAYYKWKYGIDYVFAILLAIPALVIVAAISVLVKITSKGPCLYKQVRCGLDGKPFWIYKIRTMYVDAEAATGPVWAANNDKRATFIGGFLRRTHIDELPQIYNILRGDMTLVGPRPERPEFVTVLEKRIKGYACRLFVKPGLTGLAPLNHEPDVDLNDARRKLIFDFDYLENASFLFDLRLIFCSALKMVCLCRPAVLQFFHLHRDIADSAWGEVLMPGKFAAPCDDARLSKILMKRGT